MIGDPEGLAHQYATAANRARALYRIPTAPNAGKTLELFHASEPLTHGQTLAQGGAAVCQLGIEALPVKRTGNTAAYACFDEALPFPDLSFDRVILHRTLDELSCASRQRRVDFDPTGLFRQVARVLVPGGLVAGCIGNRSKLKSAIRWLGQPGNRASAAGPAAQLGVRRLRDALSDAGFQNMRLFTVLPDCDAPLKLVDTDRATSRAAFRHELQIARHAWSRSGYLARRVAVELGLYAQLEEAFFFWAYRPC